MQYYIAGGLAILCCIAVYKKNLLLSAILGFAVLMLVLFTFGKNLFILSNSIIAVAAFSFAVTLQAFVTYFIIKVMNSNTIKSKRMVEKFILGGGLGKKQISIGKHSLEFDLFLRKIILVVSLLYMGLFGLWAYHGLVSTATSGIIKLFSHPFIVTIVIGLLVIPFVLLKIREYTKPIEAFLTKAIAGDHIVNNMLWVFVGNLVGSQTFATFAKSTAHASFMLNIASSGIAVVIVTIFLHFKNDTADLYREAERTYLLHLYMQNNKVSDEFHQNIKTVANISRHPGVDNVVKLFYSQFKELDYNYEEQRKALMRLNPHSDFWCF